MTSKTWLLALSLSFFASTASANDLMEKITTLCGMLLPAGKDDLELAPDQEDETDLRYVPGVYRLHHFEEVGPVVQTWIHWFAIDNMSGKTLGPTQTLKVGKYRYPIVAYLGVGENSTSYLMNTRYGLVTAKVFQTVQDYDKALLERRADPVLTAELPMILARDRQTKIFLLQYREGIPMRSLKDNWRKLKIPLAEFREIFRRWLILKKYIVQDYDMNVKEAAAVDDDYIYSFAEDGFRQIDFHKRIKSPFGGDLSVGK